MILTWCHNIFMNIHDMFWRSLSSSIEWDDCEDILVTGTGVVRSEGVVCLSDIDTVSTGDGCWVVCHIVDEDRVPDIRINISHIQREGSTP